MRLSEEILYPALYYKAVGSTYNWDDNWGSSLLRRVWCSILDQFEMITEVWLRRGSKQMNTTKRKCSSSTRQNERKSENRIGNQIHHTSPSIWAITIMSFISLSNWLYISFSHHRTNQVRKERSLFDTTSSTLRGLWSLQGKTPVFKHQECDLYNETRKWQV